MGRSCEWGRHEQLQWSTCFSPARSAAIYARGSLPLLLPHLLNRQSSANRDYIEDGMRGVRRQTQRVNSFPRSNADVGQIEIGALLGELLASLFGALVFIVSEALGRSLCQVACAGRCHVSTDQLSSGAGRLGGPHRIGRDPALR